MKTKLILLSSLAVLTALSACNKQENAFQESASYKEFSAGIESKTALDSDGRSLIWTGTEQIAVFSGSATTKQSFTTSSSGSVAVFSGTATNADDYYAAYPFDNATRTGAAAFRVKMPHIMHAVKDGIPDGANPSIGYTTAGAMSFSMKNIGALIKLTISKSDVKLLYIDFGTSNYMGGLRDITLDGSFIPATTAHKTGGGRANTTTLLPPVGDSHFTPGTYYVPIFPVITPVKPSIFILRDSKKYIKKTGGTTFKPERNQIINFGTIDDLDDASWSTFSNLTQDGTLDFTKANNACLYADKSGSAFASLPTDYDTGSDDTYYWKIGSAYFKLTIRGTTTETIGGYRHTTIHNATEDKDYNVLELVSENESSPSTTGRMNIPCVDKRRIEYLDITLYMKAGQANQLLRFSDTGGNAKELGTATFVAPAEDGEVTQRITCPGAGFNTPYNLCSTVPACFIRKIVVHFNSDYIE